MLNLGKKKSDSRLSLADFHLDNQNLDKSAMVNSNGGQYNKLLEDISDAIYGEYDCH